MAVVVVSHSQANTLKDVARYMYVDSAGVVCGNSRTVEGGENIKKRVDGIWWTTPKTSGMGMRTPDMVAGRIVGKKEGEMWEAPRKTRHKSVDQTRHPCQI